MKSTTGAILHAKVPAIIAATLCGILPAVKGAKDLQVPRACYGGQDVHLAIAWTGDQLKLCRDLGPRVVHGFRSVDPIGEDGERCAPHRAIGALVVYDDGGERCEKAIVWGEPKADAKGRTSFYLLKRGHAIAENLNRANDDLFVVWSNEKDHYPVALGCGRYSFQVPPGHHLPELAPIAESVKILHVKTSLVRMAIALKYLPGAQGIQVSVPPSEEVRASVSWGSGNPYAALAAEAPFLVLGFKSCEPIGGKTINGRTINIRGARISWETSDGQRSSFDLAWYGPGSAPGNIPRGWVMAKRCNGNWLEIAANDRYRADPKLRYQRISQAQIDELIAHTRKCAASYAAEEAEYKRAVSPVEEQNELGEDYPRSDLAEVTPQVPKTGDELYLNSGAFKNHERWILMRLPATRGVLRAQSERASPVPAHMIDDAIIFLTRLALCEINPRSRDHNDDQILPGKNSVSIANKVQDSMEQISSVEVTKEPQLAPAQRRKITQILLANRLASDSDCSFMAPGWCDAHLDFLAPDVVDATRKIRESLGLELVDDAAAANRELGKLLTEAADLRATAKAAIETIGTIHDRIDEISRWLADPSGKYPAQPIAFCA